MEFFATVVLIVLIICTAGVLSERYKSKARDGVSQDDFDRLENRLMRIEDRLGNMETLVVEHEKHQKFEKAL